MNKPDSPELNFMSENLYVLLLSLKPCEPIDSSDTLYLNQSHAPIVNPLKNINFKLYNEKRFTNPRKSFAPPFKHDHVTSKFLEEL